MTTVDVLRRELRNFRTLAALRYDELEARPDSMRNRLAIVIDNRTTKENPVRLDEDFYFPQVTAWEDEKVAAAVAARVEFTVPLKGYQATLPYNRVNIERPDRQARLQRMVERLVPAYDRKQVGLLMAVFRTNPMAYDGQNFFDTDHAHPASKGTYSNVLTPEFADLAAPTVDEAKALLHEARTRFVTNMTLDAEVLEAGEISQSMLVIVHNAAYWSVFERVRSIAKFDDNENELKGTFTLLLDPKPTSGEENYIEFVVSSPGGLIRPAFLVIDQDPRLDAWDDSRNSYSNAYVAVGIEGIMGVKPAFPQSSLQAQPTEAGA